MEKGRAGACQGPPQLHLCIPKSPDWKRGMDPLLWKEVGVNHFWKMALEEVGFKAWKPHLLGVWGASGGGWPCWGPWVWAL